MNKQDFSVGEVELSYKRKKTKTEQVCSSNDAYKVMRPTYPDSLIGFKEYFKVLLLDNARNVIGWSMVCEGGITDCPADVRVIFQSALLTNATALILVHNHPSGSLKPSTQDRQLTKQIYEAGKILRINVLDHLIVSDEDYYSFSDEGLL